MSEPMHCYRHPKRETRVSCATCGRPICTECMNQTAVGIKCPDDARVPRGARAGAMKTNQVVKSLLAGIAVAVLGVAVAFVIFQIPAFRLILAGLAGYLAGIFIHRAGGRNGGPLAMIISGVAVALAFAPFVLPQVLAGNFQFFVVLPAIVAIGFAVYQNR